MADSFATLAVGRLEERFRLAASPERATRMAAYMKDHFPFLGIPSPERRSLQKEAVTGLPRPSEADLREATGRLWSLPEREFQYAACDLLARNIKVASSGFLEHLRQLITTKSWWDSVDALSGEVGYLVQRDPGLVPEMDGWLNGDNLWLTRVAILHQLRYKEATDEDRLFRYCLAQAGHKDFFIRKAIGWALRGYSWTNPVAVATFVEANRDALSPLSAREALLAINGGRTGIGRKPPGA
jgi:3-methyladenine DNA glycosylase AlkD